MDRRNLKKITWIFVVLTVLVVALMLSSTLRRTSHITLPAPGESDSAQSDAPNASGDALTVVSVSRETVQSAIASLKRPQSYRRTVTVEQFWEGGSGAYKTTVHVSGDLTRTDRTMPDGRVRHTITGREMVHIWYNNEPEIYSAPVGDLTGDQAQTIPTYEEILDLPPEAIAEADYRTVSNIDCIFVETAEDEAGCVMRYWVSVDSGLLTVAEKLQDGEATYRMAALTVDEVDTRMEFILPDGTPL